MKVYCVPVHEIYSVTKEPRFVDHVVVKKTIFGCRDICSDFNFNITICCENKSVVSVFGYRPTYMEEYNCDLIIYPEDLTLKNLATVEEVKSYIDNYNSSKIAKKYREIGILSKSEKQEVKKLVKKNKNS